MHAMAASITRCRVAESRCCRTAAISTPAEHERTAAGATEHEFRPLHLVGGVAAQLAHALEDVVHAVDVPLTQQAPVGVHRQFPPDLDVPLGNEVLRFARTTEAVRLE